MTNSTTGKYSSVAFTWMVIIMDCLQTPYKLKPPTLNKQQLKSTVLQYSHQ